MTVTLGWSWVQADEAPKVIVLGDSLSAGYGLQHPQAGWVGRLQQRLSRQGYPHEVVNASISGDTSSGGLARLPRLLQQYRPTLLIVELGGNDGLRGLKLGRLRDNLGSIVDIARAAGSQVILVGIRLPPNYGVAFVERFLGVFQRVAKDRGVPLVNNLLAGFDEDRESMQDDQIHPRDEVQEAMLNNVWPTLLPLLTPAGESDHRADQGVERAIGQQL
ncbi:MAG: arylesterase [Chromatiales bacterium]|nr:arylesterase [Chromatiales bacterium]